MKTEHKTVRAKYIVGSTSSWMSFKILHDFKLASVMSPIFRHKDDNLDGIAIYLAGH